MRSVKNRVKYHLCQPIVYGPHVWKRIRLHQFVRDLELVSEVRRQVYSQVEPAIDDEVLKEFGIGMNVNLIVDHRVWDQVSAQVRERVSGLVRDQARRAWMELPDHTGSAIPREQVSFQAWPNTPGLPFLWPLKIQVWEQMQELT